MTGKRLFGLICPTAFQGLTISLGDIYLTREAAEAELADMKRMRAESVADEDPEDTGYDTAEIIVKENGDITDSFGQTIIVNDARDEKDVLRAVADLYDTRPLDELQKIVLQHYAGGEFSHLETIGQARGTECGDTLVQFLVREAGDADGDPAQLAHQLNTAINQLRDLQQALEQHAETQRPKG